MFLYVQGYHGGDTECVMCDVIKIRQKRKNYRKSGKGNLKNKMNLVTHDTFSIS